MGILLTQRGGIIGPIAKIMGFIMNAIYEALNYIGIENIGLSIILFTIIIYTFMLPMTIKQQKFSKISAIMNPEIQAIQKKYQNKKDQASMMKMQEETKLIYEKYGTSPTGGCLGSLIQLPFLFALWPVVQNIPAYVKGVKDSYMPLVNQIMATDGYQKIMEKIGSTSPINISAKTYDYTKANTIVDVLYKFQENTWNTLADKFPHLEELIESTEAAVMNLNYFPTSSFGINIAETPSTMVKAAMEPLSIGMLFIAILIPILAGFTQYLSAKISQKTTQTKNNNGKQEENAMVQQMNMMMKIMPLMSVFLCFTMPVGLGLYWITSAVVRTVQQVVINKSLNKKPIEELVKENMEKAAKKRAKKKEVESRTVSAMAQTNARRIEERKTTSNNNVDSYKPNAKPGSLAAKANMVTDYNRNKN